MKYEIKQLKSIQIQEPIAAPAPVEESSPIDHSDDIDSMKKSIDELEEALLCMKHEINQLKSEPVQEPIDLNIYLKKLNQFGIFNNEIKKLNKHQIPEEDVKFKENAISTQSRVSIFIIITIFISIFVFIIIFISIIII